ncbi:hypothetical protein A0256_01985 [Mucilaginibacter sp. PAMC 26640]|nr:hypothetical protein A0256_01985 [Mucilaginibacter sp. PAMC 26640]
MTFLSPIWFFALAALSIPVLIHLWNIRPGKTLKVGSISLITEASKNTSRSFKLMDLLLLLLRCLLLALAALFLASPVWLRNPESDKAKGWVLLPRENLKESYQKFKSRVDSLTKAGFELHYFNTGFLKIDTAKLPVIAPDTTGNAGTANYWSLIKQLDKQVSASLPVVVITPNNQHHFSGKKPSVNLNLKWQTYTAADSTSKWIAGAWFTANNAIKVTVGNSGPAGTYFTDKYIRNDGDAELTANVQNGQPVVNLKATGSTPVIVDTATLRIAVYTDQYALDANYLTAALNAVLTFRGGRAIVKQYRHPEQIPGGQTWLFWLSDAPLNSQATQKAGHTFKYEPGKVSNVSTWITATKRNALPNSEQKISLAKLIGTTQNNTAIWQDGFGRPVLSLENQHSIYHLYTHLNPAWTDLVWNDDFPKMILKLIESDPQALPAKYDKRTLSDEQLQPHKITEIKETATVKPIQKTDLSKYFWLLLIIIFIAERWLAHKTKTTVND